MHRTPKDIRSVLVKQLYSPVQWTQTIEKIAENGVAEVIECGPNKVLTSLNKRITKSMSYMSTDEFMSVQELKSTGASAIKNA